MGGSGWSHSARCLCTHLTDFSTRLKRVRGRVKHVITANPFKEVKDSWLALLMFGSAYGMFVLLFLALKLLLKLRFVN